MHLWYIIFFLSCVGGISSRTLNPYRKILKISSGSQFSYYLVDNPQCRIPAFSPYHDSIKKYTSQIENPTICSSLPALTSISFDAKTKSHKLLVNEPLVGRYSASISTLKCCYSVISRGYHHGSQESTNDNRHEVSNEYCFDKKVDLPATAEYIYVNCKSNAKTIFQTVYFLAIDKKPKTANSDVRPSKEKYSVLMFFIDSMSRPNFIRTMPKTRSYIETRGWMELEGFVKVGENTFPNAIPMFTGMNVDQLKQNCFPRQNHRLDDCPFVWKKFAEKGYLTSYSEDQTWMGTFNYHKYGFMNSPTDFYYRPISVFARNVLKNKVPYDNFCLGDTSETETLFRYNTEFLQSYSNRPYFNLFWTNAFSHDSLNMPKAMDDRILKFLQDIEAHLNHTVVVFLGDHGFRMSRIRNTYVGWQEDKTPFIYFHLPPSLKKLHPEWVSNLQKNKNKLTSPFDLHATVKELLFEEKSEAPAGCPKCGSMFAPVSEQRSCADAAIGEHYCPCWTMDGSNSNLQPPKAAPKFK